MLKKGYYFNLLDGSLLFILPKIFKIQTIYVNSLGYTWTAKQGNKDWFLEKDKYEKMLKSLMRGEIIEFLNENAIVVQRDEKEVNMAWKG